MLAGSITLNIMLAHTSDNNSHHYYLAHQNTSHGDLNYYIQLLYTITIYNYYIVYTITIYN